MKDVSGPQQGRSPDPKQSGSERKGTYLGSQPAYLAPILPVARAAVSDYTRRHHPLQMRSDDTMSDDGLPVLNEALIRGTMAAIEAAPEMWVQSGFFNRRDSFDVEGPPGDPICGTTMCFAGFAAMLTMGAEFYERFLWWDDKSGWRTQWGDRRGNICDIAKDALGLTREQASVPFS